MPSSLPRRVGVRRLFEALFDLDEDEFIELRVRRPEVKAASVYLCDGIDQAIGHVERATKQYHVWFGVAPRYKAAGTVRRLTAVWADVDAKAHGDSLEMALEIATEFHPCKPSCLVETGGGYHAYWFLNNPTNPAAARKALDNIRECIGADHTTDVTRFLRVPGTHNPKYTPPKPCKIVYITDTRYDVLDLAKASKVDKTVLRRIVTGEWEGDFPSRSERDWNVIRFLQLLGVSESCIQTIFATRPVGDKYRGERNKAHYLRQTLSKAAESLDKVTTRPAAIQDVLVEKGDGYWLMGKSAKRLSTFTFTPSRLLSTDEGDVFTGTIRAGEEEWSGINLPRAAFDRLYNLSKYLTSMHWQWLGTDAQVRVLLPHILKRFEELGGTVADAVLSIGRHGPSWVTPEGLLTTNGFVPTDVAPVVFLDQKRKYPQVQYDEPDARLDELLQTFARLYPTLNRPQVVYPLLGWMCAALIKPVIEDAGFRFPSLSVWGTKGSGKTTMISLLLKLLGIQNPEAVNCRTTPFVLLSMLASTTSLPIHLGEFRSDMTETQFRTLRTWLLMSYDTGLDARGKPDQSIVEYPLTAPLVLDGEDLIEEPAIRERMITVGMSPEVISEGEDAWLAYEEYIEFQMELLALPLTKHSLTINTDWATETIHRMLADTRYAFPAKLPNRVRNNVAVCLTGWQLFADFFKAYNVEFPPPRAEMFSECIAEVVNLTIGRTTTHVDDLVVDLVNHAASSGQGYEWRYDADTNILWVHLSTAVHWWYTYRRKAGLPIIGTPAIRRQLRERSAIYFPGPGQYVIDIKSVNFGMTTRHAYGISLDVLTESEFDVPNKLAVSQIVVKLRKER